MLPTPRRDAFPPCILTAEQSAKKGPTWSISGDIRSVRPVVRSRTHVSGDVAMQHHMQSRPRTRWRRTILDTISGRPTTLDRLIGSSCVRKRFPGRQTLAECESRHQPGHHLNHTLSHGPHSSQFGQKWSIGTNPAAFGKVHQISRSATVSVVTNRQSPWPEMPDRILRRT